MTADKFSDTFHKMKRKMSRRVPKKDVGTILIPQTGCSTGNDVSGIHAQPTEGSSVDPVLTVSFCSGTRFLKKA
jgi:hypothetical protein